MSFKRNQWPKNITFPENNFRGGEEQLLFTQFREHELQTLQVNKLSVIHDCRYNLKEFFKRAMDHGKVKAAVRRQKEAVSNFQSKDFLDELFSDFTATSLAIGYVLASKLRSVVSRG